MELLTIILKALQILTIFILFVIALTVIAIKIKSKSKEWNYSNKLESKLMNQISKKHNNEILKLSTNSSLTSKQIDNEQRIYNEKNRIYAIYSPPSNPHFYTYNKLNWYKNFD